MKPTLVTLQRFCVLISVTALSLPAFGQQIGHYIGGFTGLENGSSAPPGVYIADFGMVEKVQTIKGPNGNTALRPHINVGGAIAAYSVTTQKKMLGAELWSGLYGSHSQHPF